MNLHIEELVRTLASSADAPRLGLAVCGPPFLNTSEPGETSVALLPDALHPSAGPGYRTLLGCLRDGLERLEARAAPAPSTQNKSEAQPLGSR